jgi:hypothetical protein
MRVAHAFLMVVLMGCTRCGDGTEPAPATGTVALTNVNVETTSTDLRVRVRVENGTEAPVFVITRDRESTYHAEEKLLDVALVERPILPTGSSADCHYARPTYKRLAARRAETLELRLPRMRMRGVDSRTIVEDPFYESREVRVAIAWSDVPLVPDRDLRDPCTLGMSESVASKQRGIATGVWKAP